MTIKRGDIITIDGATGQVFKGRVPMRQPELTGDFGMLMGWADSIRTLKMRTNADTPDDAATARQASAPKASGFAAPSTCSSSGPHRRRAPDDSGG